MLSEPLHSSAYENSMSLCSEPFVRVTAKFRRGEQNHPTRLSSQACYTWLLAESLARSGLEAKNKSLTNYPDPASPLRTLVPLNKEGHPCSHH